MSSLTGLLRSRRALLLLGLLALLALVGWRRTRALSVVATPIERGSAVSAVYATGTVEAEHRRVVRARVAGLLAELPVQEGDAVQAGALLARLDVSGLRSEVRRGQADLRAALAQGGDRSPQLRALAAQAVSLESDLAQARADHQRVSALITRGAAPAAELDRRATRVSTLEAALEANRSQARGLAIELGAARSIKSETLSVLKARLQDSELRAPIDGVVLSSAFELGETVGRDQQVFKIGDVGGLILEVLVDEADVARVSDGRGGRPASKVVASLYAFPERVLRGQVFRIAPEAQRERKAFLVKIHLDDPPPGLRSGMSAEVNIVTEERKGVLVAPTAAVADGAVWVVREGRAVRAPVQLGVGDLLRTEVKSGVREGEALIVEGSAGLVEGRRVRAALVRADRRAAVPQPSAVAQNSL